MNKNFNSLFSVLTRRNISGIVCCKNGEDISWEKFLLDIRKLSQVLGEKTCSGRYLLYCRSSYEFSVALFSIWQTGSVCVLPPNNSKEVLKRFENYVDAFITDQPDCDTGLKIIEPLQNAKTNACFDLCNFPENKILLEMFTSGTTGERKCVKKTISNLNQELLDLHDMFGSVLKGTKAFSTVSHQHIYGFLHKILLPVCTDRVFIDETYFYPEKMISDMKNRENENVLITGPAHLKLLPELISLNGMNKYCKAIVSSGSLLETEVAAKISFHSGIKPVEILGSTETGGVAWRIQDELPESKKWTPFKSVQVQKNQDGFLQVKSPFVFSGDTQDGWFTMGDIVNICKDNRFYLCGRGDRIAKIGEKRVSLEEMEKILKEYGDIESCKVFPLIIKRRDYERNVLVCVIESGNVSDKEKKVVTDKLKNHLLEHFSKILIPRYWRFVQKMPLDPQGKTSIEELKKLFKKQISNV